MVDRERVLVLTDQVQQRIGHLEDWVPEDEGAFLEDDLTQNAVERALQTAIEALADIGWAFVRDLGLGLPGDEEGLTQRLQQGGVLDAEEAELLQEMRGFRNVLVHRYGTIDQRRVFENARRAPSDLKRVLNAYLDALDRP